MNESNGTTLKVENLDLEKSIIGAILQFNDAAAYATTHLSEEDFHYTCNKATFVAVKSVYESNGAVDYMIVNDKIQSSEKLKSDFPQDCIPFVYFTQCMEVANTSVLFPDRCKLLKDLAEKRRIWQLTYTLRKEIGEGYKTPDQLWQLAEAAVSDRVEYGTSETQTLAHVLGSVIGGKPQQSINTGFKFIDDKGGFAEGDLVIIAAETSQGKTSLALDICVNAARNGYPSVFYSAEMKAEQLASRMLATVSNVNANNIWRNELDEEQINATNKGIAQLDNLPIFFDDKASIDIDTIISSIRRSCRHYDAKLFFIDYLQVLQFNERLLRQTEESFFGSVARRLKNLAKELNVCIVLLSQLSRSETREPSLSRLRGSGQIAEAADVVITIYRPEEYGRSYSGSFSNVDTHRTALVKIEKGRNTGTGAFVCGFDAARTHFYDLKQIPVCVNRGSYRPFED